jgi:peptide/nickel transport system substrate-binding protein
MKKKIIWLAVSLLMVLSLVIASCGQAPEEEEAKEEEEGQVVITTEEKGEGEEEEVVQPSTDVPKYGGTINLATFGDQLEWDPVRNITGTTVTLMWQHLWEGDWTKGPAGGHGTNETDWAFSNNDLFYLKAPCIAESWDWTIDAEKGEGTIVYQIRRGIYYHQPDTAAGQLVGGRELTADDVAYVINRACNIGSVGFIWRSNPELRGTQAVKTGPWEVTVKVNLDAMRPALSRFGDGIFYYPPELVEQFGDMMDWRNCLGTGPFVLTDLIPSSVHRLERNPNYWMNDPVGPGEGNQLPYVDAVKVLIIPDASSRYAGLRTGKIDEMVPLGWEDAEQIIKTAPGIVYNSSTSWQGRGMPLMMRTDKAPYSDIRVRQAMTMAINFQEILDGLYGGVGQIITYPFSYVREYADLYLGLDDPEFPEAAREYFSYNPEKATQLLAEAGYPDGFKAKLMLTSSDTASIEYYQIIKEMWAKVGIDLEFDLREPGAANNIRNTRTHDELATWTTGPIAVYWVGNPVSGQSASNLSMIDDPIINDLMAQVRIESITDEKESMRLFKQVAKRAIEQAYAIPDVIGSYYGLWWPWLRNYSGEVTVGYDDMNWPTWVWVDEVLKKSMGY